MTENQAHSRKMHSFDTAFLDAFFSTVREMTEAPYLDLGPHFCLGYPCAVHTPFRWLSAFMPGKRELTRPPDFYLYPAFYVLLRET